MTSSDAVTGTARNSGAATGSRDEVLAALAGTAAETQRNVAEKTRRVVLASLGVMQEQKAGRKRGRAVALAAILVILLVVGPVFFWLIDLLTDEDRIPRLTGEIAVWGFFLCTALLAAGLVAGWVRLKR